MNFAYGEELNQEDGHGEVLVKPFGMPRTESVHGWLKTHEQELIQEEYIDEQTEALNEKGRDDLNSLYMNNQKFKEIINFVGDKAGLSNKPNKLGMEISLIS